MGNQISVAKTLFKKNENLELHTVLDYLATNYIIKQNNIDLENLHNREYCDKLIILTSQIIKKYYKELDIDYLEQKTHYGNIINHMNKDNVVYTHKDNVNKLEKNPLFNKMHINAKFIGETIDLSTTSFFNKKIANLIIKNGVLYENQNNLIFKVKVSITTV